MDSKIDFVILVDDDKSINYLHKILIEDSGSVNHVYINENAEDTLDFIKKRKNLNSKGIIFLDLFMPKMDGWQFIEEFKKLDIALRNNLVLIILTTSLDLNDKKKALEIEEVHEFRNKLLTKQMFKEICETISFTKKSKI